MVLTSAPSVISPGPPRQLAAVFPVLQCRPRNHDINTPWFDNEVAQAFEIGLTPNRMCKAISSNQEKYMNPPGLTAGGGLKLGDCWPLDGGCVFPPASPPGAD